MRDSGRRRAWVGALGVACALVGACLALRCATPAPPPNIVLITLDTTRADHLGCYGSAVAQTPALDAFAREAVLFENAVTAVPLTLPAHASILTGRYPPSHGVRNNASFRLEDEQQTLAEILSARGYACAAFVGASVLDRAFGLAGGFDPYDDQMSAAERPARETTGRVLEWLAAAPREPFLLWVHYFDPHTPWTAPEPFATATRGSPYDAEVSCMDAGVGEVLAALARAGLADRTHIVIVGDHGEGLGDHREHEHGIFLYEECLRVPLLWRGPGGIKPRRVAALASVVDLVPTLLDLADIAPPAGIEGRSLRSLLSGGEMPARDGVYAETMYPYYSYGWSPLYAWRTERHKYIEAPRPELYDLGSDPAEARNTRGALAATAERMGGELRRFREEQGWDRAVPAEGGVDPLLAERLTSLGYVSGARRPSAAATDTLPDPKDMIVYNERFELGKRAAQEERYADAVRELAGILERYPDNHAATYFMSIALVKTGRAQEALAHLERHMRQAPEPASWLIMGDALLALGRDDEALDWYRRAAEQVTQRAAAEERSGDALLEMGRLDEAWAAYERAAAGSPPAGLARKQARVRLRQERFAEAAAAYAEGLKAASPADRGIFEYWTAAAQRLAELGARKPAVAAPDFAAQVRAAARLGLREEARRLIDAAAGMHAASLREGLRGDAALAAEDWRAARTAYERAAALGESSPELFLGLAKACLELDDAPAAARELRRGIRATEDPQGLLHYNLACILARGGDPPGALDALATALSRGVDPATARADPDLTTLRADPAFARLTAAGGS